MASRKLPEWNLSALFAGYDDPKLAETLEVSLRRCAEFRSVYAGKMAKKIAGPTEMRELLERYEQLTEAVSKPLLYAELRFAECCTDQKRGAFLNQMRGESIKLRNELLFFTLELVKLPKELLERCIASSECARYANYLRNHCARQPYYLSESEERIFQERDLTGREAFLRLFDEELARRKFEIKLGKKRIYKSETDLLNMLYSGRRAERKAAAEALSRGLREDAPRLALISNTLAEDKRVEEKLRGIPTAETSRHLSNEISQEMVDAMSRAVTERYDIVQRYYRFKAKVLKLKKLYDYDRYAPTLTKDSTMSFGEARESILEAFLTFSNRYGEAAKLFFDRSWIDAAPREGKRGGAFCSFMTPDTHPVVFMNYTGSLREVFTLAHELGHGLHAHFMKPQGILNFDTPLTVAETASVFAEMLLFAGLKKKVKNRKALLSMYMSKLENIIATVFRQVSMYRFEQDVHAARASGEISIERLNSFWRTRQKEVFGSSVTLSPGYDVWWSYIPHFLHSPFYVYAYAFGELLTLALYSQYEARPEGFADRYLEMLSLGSSKSPEELVAPFGLSLKNPEFWNGGVQLIESLLAQAEALR